MNATAPTRAPSGVPMDLLPAEAQAKIRMGRMYAAACCISAGVLIGMGARLALCDPSGNPLVLPEELQAFMMLQLMAQGFDVAPRRQPLVQAVTSLAGVDAMVADIERRGR